MIRSGKALRRWLVAAGVSVLAFLLSGCAAMMNPGGMINGRQPRDAGVTILLTSAKDPVPKSCKVYRSQWNDHVRWHNQTDVARTITFQTGIWPFEEAQVVIQVPARGVSLWYNVGPKLQMRQYTYKVQPPLGSFGPPGDPDITGGD